MRATSKKYPSTNCRVGNDKLLMYNNMIALASMLRKTPIDGNRLVGRHLMDYGLIHGYYKAATVYLGFSESEFEQLKSINKNQAKAA